MSHEHILTAESASVNPSLGCGEHPSISTYRFMKLALLAHSYLTWDASDGMDAVIIKCNKQQHSGNMRSFIGNQQCDPEAPKRKKS